MEPNLFRYVWTHSRAEQIFLFVVIVASLPFYWVSLELPKLIVNDAIQGRAFTDGKTTVLAFSWAVHLPDFLGGESLVFSKGVLLERIPYLLALSVCFLFLTLVNGAFKYVINIRKGILGERMLRRLRFDLIHLLLRFRPEDIGAVKPAEVASMIKDEVDPIGGFIGDAFIQPLFLFTQGATAVLFIMMQSALMGGAALAIVLTQAFIIPRLRREQLRLGRRRQIESRRLAGRIGEVVDGAPTIHAYGVSGFIEAELGSRLGTLFDIRAALFRRKFAVKFLNSMLAQVTPFIFYTIGGYYAVMGTLNIGQLVAVINAYQDLPPPIKELIDWDQQRQDVQIKYEQVVGQFSPPILLPVVSADMPLFEPPPSASIGVLGLRVLDIRGRPLLEQMSLSIARPSHVALLSEPASGAGVLARVLGRRVSEYEGSVSIGETDLAAFPDQTLSRFQTYVGPEQGFPADSIRQNILLGVWRRTPELAEPTTVEERRRRMEARQSGNPEAPPDADWLDYDAMGIDDPQQIDQAILKMLEVVGASRDVYLLGVRGHFGPQTDPQILALFVEARHRIRDRLAGPDMLNYVEPFDPKRYNVNATVAENLMFGIAVGSRLSDGGLANNAFVRETLERTGTLKLLLAAAMRIAKTAVTTFADLPPDHPVFQRFTFIHPGDLPRLRLIRPPSRGRDLLDLPSAQKNDLLTLIFGYLEPRHRLGLVNDDFKDAVMKARVYFHQHLPAQYADDIEFYDPDRYIVAGSLRDNLLFGRVADRKAVAPPKVFAVIEQVLGELKLGRHVLDQGLSFDVGHNGQLLTAAQAIKIGLARALIGRPDILIVDGILEGLGSTEAKAVLQRLRQHMEDRTLIVATANVDEAAALDRTIAFEGPFLAKPPVVELAKTA